MCAYTRQVNEVAIEIPNGWLGEAERPVIERLFNARYEDMYGSGAGHAEAGVEVISIAIDAVGSTVKPNLRRVALVGADSSAARKGTRRAWFTGRNPGWRDAVVYEYTKLHAGNELRGPAIIETPFTTVLVPENHEACVDEYLNIILRR